MNTKEKYMLEALRLFSEKGYSSVGVTEIAEAVGCTTSALYKHFPNKKALFDAIVEKSKTEFEEKMLEIHGNMSDMDDLKGYVSRMNVEKQVEMMQNLFRSLVEDGPNKNFRRLVSVERFDHPELAEIYVESYVKQMVSYFSRIMSLWMDEEKICYESPDVLALEYISPLLTMVDIVDMDHTRMDECMKNLKKHVVIFNKLISWKG